ncbi:DUF1643 domain-containing protein [Paenibacillus thalictri]|uniref:DUF1643 domain-containing protein n=1 Tax=Paenibacillus thalictri TaxID=2527873 RepID=A0A4Q9DZW4_9BACL|nr:DUF1643 domain-containing protein [Paenibacillus thalictri]TBL80831.1 DUF1643 domain-containing protein [Paenibacillus thalictri]
MKREAVIDATGTYRYLLRREWDSAKPKALWIMLNPSTADHEEDDPTIKACTRFSLGWGYGSFEVVNLFAYRATHPSELKKIEKPIAIGAENGAFVREALAKADVIVAAWGAHGKIHKRNQDMHFISLIDKYELKCLDILTYGDPRHPLYVSADTLLREFKPQGMLRYPFTS